ncbi:MAG: type II toxin-antitoxin system HicB family antitoxin, partial [Calditrichota bacterium]
PSPVRGRGGIVKRHLTEPGQLDVQSGKKFLREKPMTTAQRTAIAFDVPIMVEPDGHTFYAHSPILKGLHVDGATKEEALDNARIGAKLLIESMIKDGEPIPLGLKTWATGIAESQQGEYFLERIKVFCR